MAGTAGATIFIAACGKTSSKTRMEKSIPDD
jgi:hypothetical protein